MERTFAIIKPDAVAARYTGRIIQRIEEAGFTIRAMRLLHLSQKEAEGFYAVHKERPFFASLTKFMSSGPCVVMALEAPDAIKKWRTLMGATDPAKADANTLRKDFGAVDREQRHARLRRPRHRRLRARLLLSRHGILPVAGAVSGKPEAGSWKLIWQGSSRTSGSGGWRSSTG